MMILVACHDRIIHALEGDFQCRIPKPWNVDYIDTTAGTVSDDASYAEYLEDMGHPSSPQTLKDLHDAHVKYNAEHASSKQYTKWDHILPNTYDYVFFASCPFFGRPGDFELQLMQNSRRVLKRGGKLVVMMNMLEEPLSELSMMNEGLHPPITDMALVQHLVAKEQRHGLDYWFSSSTEFWLDPSPFNRIMAEYIKIK